MSIASEPLMLDVPLCDREPSHHTALRAVKCPEGPKIQANWDNGSGFSMKCSAGQTAFVSSIQKYSLLSAEEKILTDNSWVEYAPFGAYDGGHA